MRITRYILEPFVVLFRLATNAHYRSALVTRLRFGPSYRQLSSFTLADRFKKVFTACAAYFQDAGDLRILSFGCATGEEVATLGTYFPSASVVGTDINRWCIRQCRKKYTDARLSFYHRFDAGFVSARGFDAIFCMAVLQHPYNRTAKSARAYTFSQFQEDIALLDSKLRPGGLLSIDHADFLFTDTDCAAKYQPLSFPGNHAIRKRPLFDRLNNRVAEEQIIDRVFIKVSS